MLALLVLQRLREALLRLTRPFDPSLRQGKLGTGQFAENPAMLALRFQQLQGGVGTADLGPAQGLLPLPPPTGPVVRVADAAALARAVREIASGTTVLWVIVWFLLGWYHRAEGDLDSRVLEFVDGGLDLGHRVDDAAGAATNVNSPVVLGAGEAVYGDR